MSGVCAVSLIVDASGMPQNVPVVKSLESGLDQNAIKAVSQYRFKPAMKDGTTPVPVQITVRGGLPALQLGGSCIRRLPQSLPELSKDLASETWEEK